MIVHGIMVYYELGMMNPYLCISSTVPLPNIIHTHTYTQDCKVVTHGPKQYIEMSCLLWLLQYI